MEKTNWMEYDADEMVKGDKNYLWHHLKPHKVFETKEQMVVVKGEGIVITDIRGNEYIDVTSGGVWSVMVGYGRESIAKAVYDQLVEMDDINPDLPNTDVVVVIGANDVVNPAALDDPSSPIYGMPIINAHEAKNVIVMKRGMGKGYAAIENYLFFADNTRMFFGSAKDSIQKLVTEIKAL